MRAGCRRRAGVAGGAKPYSRKQSVETPAGTAFTATFDPTLAWVKTSGLINTRYWSNLPAGEVFTTPASVIDAAMREFQSLDSEVSS